MIHPSLYRLDGSNATWLFAARADLEAGANHQTPELLYWGSRLADGVELDPDFVQALERPLPHGGLDDEEPLSCLPEAGRGWSGHPGLEVDRAGDQTLTQLILEGSTAQTASSIGFHLVEARTNLELMVALEVAPGTDVLTASTTLTNRDPDKPLSVSWLAAISLPIPRRCCEVLLFDGRWCGEFAHARHTLGSGLLVKENRTGRTSHHSFPALLCGEPGFDHDHGRVFAAHLGWSGNHRLLVERCRDGRIQAQLGELLAPGEIELAPGESYATPTLYLSSSGEGLNGLSRQFHGFVRSRLATPSLHLHPRPVHFNTWESLYFDHSEARTLELVAEAAALGAERFVLDDGWFQGRNDDRAGLGDWSVCPEKYPNGLEPIARACRRAGLQFGLWVEPEMAQIESDLFRRHPDWLLRDGDRKQPLGRYQYALDLSRTDVQDHLFQVLLGLVDRYQLAYLKWDMNRDLCHAVSSGRPSVHRQTLGTYRLIDRLRAERPQLEIEACASGGGRIDYAMLSRSERFWASDSHDPLERQKIHRGMNLFFPPEVLGAHVGSERCHTSGRRHSMELRAATALFGHFGLEASFADEGQGERARLAFYLELYKQHRIWLHRCDSRYLESADRGCIARLAIAPEAEQALLSVAQLETPRFAIPPRLSLTGLDDAALYQVELLNPEQHVHAKLRPALHRGKVTHLTGQTLRQTGLQLPLQLPESVALFSLRRLKGPDPK